MEEVCLLYKCREQDKSIEGRALNFVTFYQGASMIFLGHYSYYNEVAQSMLSAGAFMFLHLYRMYITKINTEKITEIWMSKDL